MYLVYNETVILNATLDITRPSEERSSDTGYKVQTAEAVFSGVQCKYSPSKGQRFVAEAGEQSFDVPRDSVLLYGNTTIVQEGDIAVVHTGGTKRTFVVENSYIAKGVTLSHWRVSLKAVDVLKADEEVPESFLAQPDASLIIQPDGSKILVY